MPGRKDRARPEGLRVEEWEIETVESVARSFRTFPDADDLKAEMFKRLLELKRKRRPGIRDWKKYLARSLYNAAHNFIEKWNVRNRGAQSLDLRLEINDEGQEASLEEFLAAPEAPADLRLELREVWETLSPELRELWDLLAEEGGNQAAVARRLGRPVDTVKYWYKKIRNLLKDRGLG